MIRPRPCPQPTSLAIAIEPDPRGSTPIYGAPLVLGDTVVLAAMPGVVYGINRRDGKLLWQLRPTGESGVFAIDPP